MVFRIGLLIVTLTIVLFLASTTTTTTTSQHHHRLQNLGNIIAYWHSGNKNITMNFLIGEYNDPPSLIVDQRFFYVNESEVKSRFLTTGRVNDRDIGKAAANRWFIKISGEGMPSFLQMGEVINNSFVIELVPPIDIDEMPRLDPYQSLIRSKSDYGCIVYGSARKSYLDSLDSLHNQGLRIVIGPFKSSPISSLYAKQINRLYISEEKKYYYNMQQKKPKNPNNPSFDVLFDPIDKEYYNAIKL